MKEYVVTPVELRVKNEDLKKYLEKGILPRYDEVDVGHGRNHIYKVLKFAYKLNEELGVVVDWSLLTVTVIFHDMGVTGGKNNTREARVGHNERSATIVRRDEKLREFFSEEEIEEIAIACYEHRASYKGERKSLLSKIVADADTADSINFERILVYYDEKYPGESADYILEKMLTHYLGKHGRKSGYARFDLKEAEELAKPQRELLWSLIDDEEKEENEDGVMGKRGEKFKEYMWQHYSEWLE